MLRVEELTTDYGPVRAVDGVSLEAPEGTVTAVRDDDGVRLVDCDIWTETQTGERKVVGSATLALPR